MSCYAYEEQLKPKSCAFCGTVPDRLLRCNRCKVSKYCNVECQKGHWKANHKNQCQVLANQREFWVQDAYSAAEDGTTLFIIATRVALGDGTIQDVKLATDLYQQAVETDKPIRDGHPVAMVHLALHYERGIGVDRDYEQAFRLYNRVLHHGHAGEENVCASFKGLARLYQEGLGVPQSDENARKYTTFSRSNPETVEEPMHLEKLWEETGRDLRP
jgi:hypothetical protein